MGRQSERTPEGYYGTDPTTGFTPHKAVAPETMRACPETHSLTIKVFFIIEINLI
jgi:hypothetical protein